MNYYYRYLGDYAKDTTHLTLMQNGAYNFLLDRYYAAERGIPADEVYLVCRAHSRDEKRAVDKVLKEFFKLRGGTWTMAKCEKEIANARQRIEAARLNGQKGGRPKTQQEPSGLANDNPTITQPVSQMKAIQSLNLQSSINKNSEGQNGLSRKEQLMNAIRKTAQGMKTKESP